MKYLSILFFYLFSLTCSSQSNIEISGNIFFEKDSLPVNNAQIALKKHSYGTTTNKEGAFRIKLKHDYIRDSLAIHFIGYQTLTLSIGDLVESGKDRFYLIESSITLNEVFITPVNAKDIIANAIKQLPNNYSTKKQKYDIDYKEIKKINNNYVTYLEVAADLVSKGFSNKYIANDNNYTKIFLKGKRASYNYDTTYEGGNGINTLFGAYWARMYLTKKALKAYTYEFEGQISYRNQEVYKISVKSSQTGYTTYMYISLKDYAIVAIDVLFDSSLQEKKNGTEYWWFLKLRYQIDFIKKDENWYVNTINDYRKTMRVEGNVYELQRSIKVMGISDKTNISTQYEVNSDTDLFNYSFPYNYEFWDNYNAPLETEEEKKIKSDLERGGKNLNFQFKKIK